MAQKQNTKNKKKLAGKKKSVNQPRRNTQVAVRSAKQIVQYVPARPRADATIKRYVATVANPFHPYANSRGIWANGTHTASAVVRRVNICSVTLNPNAGGVNSGVDIFIPLSQLYDPYVQAVTNSAADWTGTSTSVTYGYGSSYSVPNGSFIRVVSAGVKITCLDPPDYTGGKFHLFKSPQSATGDAYIGGAGTTFGAVKTALQERLASAQVKSGEPITFLFSGTHQLMPANSAVAASIWNYAVDGIRLFYDASTAIGGRFEFEIASVVEYCHDSHRGFALPTIAHPMGEQVQLGVASHITSVGANNAYVEGSGGHGAVYNKIMAGLGFVEDVGKSAMRIAGTAYQAIQGAKVIKNAYAGLTSMGEASLLLAA